MHYNKSLYNQSLIGYIIIVNAIYSTTIIITYHTFINDNLNVYATYISYQSALSAA